MIWPPAVLLILPYFLGAGSCTGRHHCLACPAPTAACFQSPGDRSAFPFNGRSDLWGKKEDYFSYGLAREAGRAEALPRMSSTITSARVMGMTSSRSVGMGTP